ncbi:XrtA/PEP-CTERM system exopolysaccharide export protein [Marinagarivorans cellulosilyticus]|uniref:Polysaccharide biosynthesis/export protein n=1 Tax=Marinagarivorans cellulosilyticus TaxID=2721545 RepID=A0AAN1WI73_9GAMM|nr:XrtA/PEP-CTERM system exopolysaccharide export protein [Marinagarivorans cellulosilyticus]BCD98051.1 polysaccharide biosynthesis/export protein [Marinagarivorans cellulosilyticus]
MKHLMALFLLSLLAGCSTTPEPSIVPAPITNTGADYQMGVGDEISVQVWKSPELSVDVPVRPDGKVSVPLVGDVVAIGKSTKDLSKELTNEFGAYVRNPQVTVIVRNPASANFLRRVRVTGAVGSPLSVMHQQGMTVLDMVLLAGGLTEFASGNNAKLYRKYGDKVEVFPIYLSDMLEKGRLDTNYELHPADIITVPERIF